MAVSTTSTIRSRTYYFGNTEWLASRLDDCDTDAVVIPRGTTASSVDYNYGLIKSGAYLGQDSTTKEWHPNGACLTTANDSNGNVLTVGTTFVQFFLPGQTIHVYQGTNTSSSRSTTDRTITARDLVAGTITFDGSAFDPASGDLVKRMGGSGDVTRLLWGDCNTAYPGVIKPDGTVLNQDQFVQCLRVARVVETKIPVTNAVLKAALVAVGFKFE